MPERRHCYSEKVAFGFEGMFTKLQTIRPLLGTGCRFRVANLSIFPSMRVSQTGTKRTVWECGPTRGRDPLPKQSGIPMCIN